MMSLLRKMRRYLCLRDDYALVRNRQRRCNRIQRESQPLPLVVAAAQGADALDAQLVQNHGGFGGGSLAGAGAKKHDVAVAGNLVMALGQRFGGEMERAGQCERV